MIFTGKRYECTGKDQKEADQKAAVKHDRLKRGEVGISGNMTVARWAVEWLETYKRPSVGAAQYRNYLMYIDGIIVPAIGSIPLKSVKDIHLQKILNSRAGKSKSDISKLNLTVKAIFQKAYQSGLIIKNPAEFLEPPAATDGKRRSITDEERKSILSLAETHHAGLWIKTLLYTGIRPGETRALDWRHVDFEKRLIHVEQAMKAGTKKIGEPKSAAGIRNIPIPDKLYSVLLAQRKSPFEPVFIQSTTGLRHTEETAGHRFESDRELH